MKYGQCVCVRTDSFDLPALYHLPFTFSFSLHLPLLTPLRREVMIDDDEVVMMR